MIDAARIQSVVELLDRLAHSFSEGGASADVILRQYFQGRRYAGSKDRRAISGLYYQIIRHWGGLLNSVGEFSSRRMVIAGLLYIQSQEETDVRNLFSGQTHGPDALSVDEEAFLEKISATPFEDVLYPDWMEKTLEDRFGDGLADAMTSLNERAPVGVRVNFQKGTKAEVAKTLQEKEISCTEGQWATTCLNLEDQVQLRDLPIYKNGLVEIQDEAAQLAVELADIQPGQQVMDYCAGAGGKTLAAAAFMQNKGQIYALDVSKSRLNDLKPRAKRAGAHVIQTILLGHSAAKREKQLEEHGGRIDRLLLDVPCSGSGTWRRNPESKWRLNEDQLAEYVRTQKELLAEVWPYVKKGGRLIYMTCSLFPEENERQIEAFLKAAPEAGLRDYKDFIRGECPQSLSRLPGTLQLAPHKHGCDGFFVAILERRA
ncbi:RsmB/NOP family class I SAM-dependent RNA methyltransferase [Emcibacter sp.]|uniref:RsmB/NOP family class I SAM-dependent RNA methyltransferase n=1 Tax=Emcibacter sp. TaxID=1979954 RepID=UPI002AA838BE|nr:RsmB/NOP family class I SAM-dependent RNA methyltransferase [Emcibacter sp.]